MNIIMTAAVLARKAHGDQKRKFNGKPYVTHPARVAARVLLIPDATEDMVAAALLHDVIEDTEVQPHEISWATNPAVRELVVWMTNPSKGSKAPRAERKAMDREHLAKAPREVKILKMLDRIDNLSEMEGAERGFMKLYSEESLLLAEAIGDADPELKSELLAASRRLLDLFVAHGEARQKLAEIQARLNAKGPSA